VAYLHLKKFKAEYSNKIKQGKLSVDELYKAIGKYEVIIEKTVLPLWYLELVYYTDLENQKLLSIVSKAELMYSEIMKNLSFFENDLSRTTASYKKRVFKSKKLSHYHNYLEKIIRQEKHILDEELELLLIDKDINGRSSWQKFRGIFESKFTFEFKTPEDRERRTYLLSELTKVASKHPDANIRYKAAEMIMTRYKDNSYIFGFIYNSIIQDMIIIDKGRRKYTPLIEKRNISNELSDRQVNTLLDSVTEHYVLAQRYWKLKAKILKLDKLRSCDVYAPYVVKGSIDKFSYTQGLKLIQDSIDSFHKPMGDLFENMYRCGLTEARLKPGKRSGAFCAMLATSTPPVIFTNYTGSLRDVFTVAHEGGHWIHHALMAENQTSITSHTPLTTAETASVFCEMLLAAHITDVLRDKKEMLLSFLMEKIDDIFATVFRQTAFSKFEQLAFKESEKQPLTDDMFSECFEEEYGKLFGKAVEMTSNYKYQWAYVPHFVNSPFYVYAYSFGELATIALYQKYLEKPHGFPEKYMKFLSTGSKLNPNELYKTMGINISSKSTWDEAFKYIESLVNKVEKLYRSVK
jgi:oligoendopeptidase F